MSAPAPATHRVLAQARFEASVLLRNGEQLLLAIVLPVGALLGLAATSVPDLGTGLGTGVGAGVAGPLPGAARIDIATPGVLAMCIVSAAFTSQAIALGFDRRYAVLRYLGTTALGRVGLLVSKALATVVVGLVQVVVVGGTAAALGWRPVASGVPAASLVALLGVAAFTAAAVLIGGTLRAEGVLAVANLLWVVFVAIGGLIVPSTQLPGALGAVVSWLPTAALGDGLRTAYLTGGLDVRAGLLLAGWAVLLGALGSRLFRWTD